MKESYYVQYGCGMNAPEQWRNFDSSPTLRFEKIPLIGLMYTKNKSRFPKNVEYGDIVKGLPINENVCKGIYCSHILEHLCLNDFRIAILNTFKILHPNGIFRLVIPDLEYAIKKYLENPLNNSSQEFMRNTSLGYENRSKNIVNFFKFWLGNSQHLWMWDYKSIKSELEESGFVNIRRASYGDSVDPLFKIVEEKSRWENCLGVECRKAV